ncbi:MAG: VIT1/CCC1 transporter family protein [Dehalococcoidia bacterium]|nr:VIT1/CCC1 transporter family protein [Dehalococcoidia bacterium]
MNSMQIDKKVRAAQKSEITEHFIYQKLSQSTKDANNKEILLSISLDEMKHYRLWQDYTKQAEKPNWIRVWVYYLISRIFGLTFGIKLMERGEGKAQTIYQEISHSMPEALDIAKEESVHEAQLLQMIDEERLNYVGSMIRGLNDALVELTGALAGFTFALQDSRLIAMAGLITGIAAAMSMGGTEYLAKKAEESGQSPLKSAMYTGIAYIFTVAFLVFPYLLFTSIYIALAVMIVDAIIVITVFNFYISVAKDVPFWKRFSEMALLSLGITAVSFVIGLLVRQFLGVEV